MSYILSKINHFFNKIKESIIINNLEKNLDVYIEIKEIKNSSNININKK